MIPTKLKTAVIDGTDEHTNSPVYPIPPLYSDIRGIHTHINEIGYNRHFFFYIKFVLFYYTCFRYLNQHFSLLPCTYDTLFKLYLLSCLFSTINYTGG